MNLVPILNATPDSFSDGNTLTCENILEKVSEFKKSPYFKFVDIGAESTRPNAKFVSIEEEWARLKPFLEILSKNNIPFSVDSRKLEIQKEALYYSPIALNDVSGNNEIFELAQKHQLYYIAMHSRGDPTTMLHEEKKSLLEEDFLKYFDRFKVYEKTFFDPGIGFGKSREQDLSSIFWCLKTFPREKVFIGASRKRFLDWLQDDFSDTLSREFAHCALIDFLLSKGILWYRVHETIPITRFVNSKKKMDGNKFF